MQLAEMMSIPVATSLNAKGTILDDHPLSVGVCGSYSRWRANRVVAEADLVVFIGSHTGNQVTNDWSIPAQGTPVILIGIDPSELGRSYPTKAALHGDAKASVLRLMEALEPLGPRTEWVDRAQQLVRDWRQEVAPLADSESTPILPQRLWKEITDWLPSDSVLVAYTEQSGIWTGSMVDFKHPDQSFPGAAASLGWAFPAALGAECAVPERQVVCFTGDVGFWYHMSELETALRYGINAIIVVNDNHSLNRKKEVTSSPTAESLVTRTSFGSSWKWTLPS